MPAPVVLRASAKINLTLRVGSRRPDGYHEVGTLLQSIALSDTLTCTVRRGPFVLVSRSLDVPTDRTNLVWRAADVLWRALGRAGEARGTRVELQKSIPVASGLGGGSADAAAALIGLNRLWRGKLPLVELIALAATLGADVPFFLHGGTALGLARGEELYPVDDVRRLDLVVVTPSFGIAAADAYRWLDEDRAHQLASSQVHRLTGSPAHRLLDVGWPTGPLTMGNDLEAPVSHRYPEIAGIIEAARQAGATAAAMTGSGSAVFAVFPAAEIHRAVRRLARPGWRVLATSTLSRRAARRRLGL